MTAWRTLFTYNFYAQTTARALRASLKEPLNTESLRRGLTQVRYQKWENGVGGQQVLLKEEPATTK